jgi:hypothetical protein
MATLDTIQNAVDQLTESTTTLLNEVNVNKSTLINSANSASNSANNAAASASTATTQASNASASATAASNSAAQAASAAVGAEQIVLGVETNRPDIRPSLNLDFANVKALDPRVTFARASAGVAYDGKTVAKAEENLLLRSQEFNEAVWVKTNATITANTTTAPDGTTTADTLTPSATSGTHSARQSFTAVAGSYVFSCFIKEGTSPYVQLCENTNVNIYANFDLNAGTLGTVGSSTTATITSAGGGWYRCTIAFTVSASANIVYLNSITSSTSARAQSWDAAGTETVFLWGAQLEQRSAVTAYTPTTTQPITNYIPVLQTASAGVARFDHNPVTGESLGLLVEEQRTNLVTYSEQFDNAAWVKNTATVVANTVVAPDGTLTADSLLETTANGNAFITQTVTATASTVYTTSVYAKTNGRVLQITFGTGDVSGNPRANYDLSTGTLGTVDGGITATITAVGNGWYRCTATATSAVTSFRPIIALVASTTAARVASFQGDGYSGIYIWGAQLEAGAFPTSYIKTEASQVTRSADSASMTGSNFSGWYRQDEGTLYGEASQLTPTSSYFPIAAISDNTTLNQITLESGPDTHFFVSANGTTQVNIDAGTTVSNVYSKLIASYKLNNFAVSINSGTVGVDTLGLVPVVNRMYFASANGLVSYSGRIKKLAYYPARLTNEQLQALTS